MADATIKTGLLLPSQTVTIQLYAVDAVLAGLYAMTEDAARPGNYSVTIVGQAAGDYYYAIMYDGNRIGTGIIRFKSTTATYELCKDDLTLGITSLPDWLGALAGKTADATTLAEINATAAGANYDNTTDSEEAIADGQAVIDALLDKIAVPIIGTCTNAGTGTEIFVHGGLTLTATVDVNGNRPAMVFS